MSLKFSALGKKEGKDPMTLYMYCIIKPKYSPQSNRGQTEILTRFILHMGWTW